MEVKQEEEKSKSTTFDKIDLTIFLIISFMLVPLRIAYTPGGIYYDAGVVTGSLIAIILWPGIIVFILRKLTKISFKKLKMVFRIGMVLAFILHVAQMYYSEKNRIVEDEITNLENYKQETNNFYSNAIDKDGIVDTEKLNNLQQSKIESFDRIMENLSGHEKDAAEII